MDALRVLAQHFSVLRLRVILQLQDNWELPAFKGSLFHGWFGQAIKQYDEQAFHILFTEHDAGQPKPYALKLANDHKTKWHKHELIHFDVMLFGEAVQLAERLVGALKQGEQLGLGSRNNGARCPVSLVSLASVVGATVKPGIHSVCLADCLTTDNTQPNCELALHLLSPLRLKHLGKINQVKAPSLPFIIQQTCRRLSLLSKFWVSDNNELLQAVFHAQPRFSLVETNSHIYFENWQRFSLNMNKHISFGGLKGQLSFYGDIHMAKPWLQIAQTIGVGGKTTFGLGDLVLIG